MTTVEEVFVVTSSGSGHLFPSIELCKHLSSCNYKTTLVLPSNLSSSLPHSLLHHPLLATAEISEGPPTSPHLDLEAHLTRRSTGSDSARPICAIVDFRMGGTKHVFWKFNVPVISFFTFGACAAAMEWGAWKADAGKIKAGEVLNIPGLPKEMTVRFSDLKGRPTRPSPPNSTQPPLGGGGPPQPGDRPPWVALVEGSIGLMFNTCDDLERPFIDYMANQMAMPVWGVGPLLPEKYWQSSDTVISDRQIRQPTHQVTNHTEEEVTQWLDSKPRGSVIYVSFGSEVGPTTEEYTHLASALEETAHPFIWVIQQKSKLYGSNGEGYFPGHGMDEKVGNRGLIIRGWAPQLLILSHHSTGGFLSHCGWNSTVEAMGRGVPFLAWPIRGDQIYNAKLVVNYLKVGYMAMSEEGEGTLGIVKKKVLLRGIEKLMTDEDVHKRAALAKFHSSFPKSSDDALDVFRSVITDH